MAKNIINTIVVIIAGGKGIRMGEATANVPKALVKIGNLPIIEHVIRLYQKFGFQNFIVAGGDQFETLFSYFEDSPDSDRKVTVVDTGRDTQNGGRLLKIKDMLIGETFCASWCDGLSNIDLGAFLIFHQEHGQTGSIAAVHPPSQFGIMTIEENQVIDFYEKPILLDQWINGAFYVFGPKIFNYIHSENDQFEVDILPEMAKAGELMAFKHNGYWQCMDTNKDKQLMDTHASMSPPPWTFRIDQK